MLIKDVLFKVTVCVAVLPSCKKVLFEVFTFVKEYVSISVVTILLSRVSVCVEPSGKV